MAWLTTGKHSYYGQLHEYFEPIVTIGNFSSLASPCTFLGKAQHPSYMDKKLVSNYPFNNVPFGTTANIDYPKSGGNYEISIGNDVWIGYDCVIMGGVTIGDGAIIGARTTINKNVPPYAVAVGKPFVIKKYRFSQDIIDKLLKIRWWDLKDDVILELIRNKWLLDINNFIEYYEKNLDKFTEEYYEQN